VRLKEIDLQSMFYNILQQQVYISAHFVSVFISV
jgi:hypothetical protein